MSHDKFELDQNAPICDRHEGRKPRNSSTIGLNIKLWIIGDEIDFLIKAITTKNVYMRIALGLWN
jgi:hypothetical protein